MLVHASRYEEMKQALGAALGRLEIGPGTQVTAEMGPLIDRTSLEKVSQRIEEAMEAADEVVLRGARPGGTSLAGSF